LVICAAVLALGVQHAEAVTPGALKLDNYTFDKALAIPGHDFLVKFDQNYAYGEKEDEFKALCKLAYTVPKFFVAEVPVQEYGDMENDDLKQRFKLNKEHFPVYFLFNEANKEGVKYHGAIKADDLVSFLRKHKIKMPSIGTIEELDGLVKKFLKEGKADATVAEAKKLAEGEYKTDAKAPHYAKIMAKIQEKGEGYVETETARVSKILEGKLSEEKKAEMNTKIKILNVFAAKDEL